MKNEKKEKRSLGAYLLRVFLISVAVCVVVYGIILLLKLAGIGTLAIEKSLRILLPVFIAVFCVTYVRYK